MMTKRKVRPRHITRLASCVYLMTKSKNQDTNYTFRVLMYTYDRKKSRTNTNYATLPAVLMLTSQFIGFCSDVMQSPSVIRRYRRWLSGWRPAIFHDLGVLSSLIQRSPSKQLGNHRSKVASNANFSGRCPAVISQGDVMISGRRG